MCHITATAKAASAPAATTAPEAQQATPTPSQPPLPQAPALWLQRPGGLAAWRSTSEAQTDRRATLLSGAWPEVQADGSCTGHR